MTGVGCFTGHRPTKLGGYREPNATSVHVQEQLRLHLRLLHQEPGVTTWITGMAQGFDIWAGEAVVELRAQLPEFRLIAAVPFLTQPLVWPHAARLRWCQLLKQCDEIWICNQNERVTWQDVRDRLRPLWSNPPEQFDAGRLLNARNHWMVDRSGLVLACWDQSPGGTGNCVRYAREQGRQLVYLDPRNAR